MEKDFDNIYSVMKQSPIPQDIHQRILDTCKALPERSRPPRRTVKVFVASVSSVAAAFLILMGINAANPVFAESIPWVGGIFKQINSEMKHAVGSNIETYGKIETVEGVSAVSEGVELTLHEIYSDGLYIHCAFGLSLPEDVQYNAVCAFIDAKVDGTEIEGRENNRNVIYMEPDEDGGYSGTCALKLPSPAENGEKLELSYSMYQLSCAEEWNYTDRELEESISGTYSVTADTSDNYTAGSLTGSGDVKILSFEVNPSYTKIEYEAPFWGETHRMANGNPPKLYLADGSDVRYSTDDTSSMRADSLADIQSIRGTVWYDGVPEGTDKLVLRFGNSSLQEPGMAELAKVIAEVTIDLNSNTYTQTESYKGQGVKAYDDLYTGYDSLNWSIIFDELFYNPQYHNALTDEMVFAMDDIFQNDFAPECITINRDGSAEMSWFKRGNDYKAVTLSIEKDGETVGKVDTTEADRFDNVTLAGCRGDTKPLYDELEENPTDDEERNRDYKRILDESIAKKVDGQSFYNIRFNLNDGAEIKLMDTVTLKLTDPESGKIIYSREILLGNKEMEDR